MKASMIGWLAAGALVLAAARADAQTDARLADAVRAAQEGSGDSARASVERLLAATSPSDSVYPQILYTQAMVAATAGDMRRLLQRIAIEYGTSSWADDALVRLVQMDYATRNYEGAARNLERLKLDYPSTPLLAQAAYWAGRTYFDANNPAAACRWLTDGMGQSQRDVELQNQLGFLFQRCDVRADSGATPLATDSARADPTVRSDTSAATPRVPASPSASVYRVQIAAVATRKGAEEAARRARPLGLTVLTVEDRGLYKVRIGEYPTREAAQTAAGSLQARLGGHPFVVAEP